METKFIKLLLIFVYKANEGAKVSFNVFKIENYNEVTKKNRNVL